MADESHLKTWVSDKLMSLMGYSQNIVVQYVIRLSKEASSPSDLVSKLIDYGWSSSAETLNFAQEMFAKVPHRQSGPSIYQKQEREAAKFAKKQSSYKLLDADDEDDTDNPIPTPKQEKGRSKKRFRKKEEARDSEEEEEIPVVRRNERNLRRRTSKEEENGDDSESEEAIMRDQEERAQLERNMRERDAMRTRQMMEPKLSKREEEETIRRSKALEENETSDIRKVSREVYLKKRRDQKLVEIQEEIIDNEYLFEGIKMTRTEERELSYKKKIYELAKEHLEEVDNNEEIQHLVSKLHGLDGLHISDEQFNVFITISRRALYYKAPHYSMVPTTPIGRQG